MPPPFAALAFFRRTATMTGETKEAVSMEVLCRRLRRGDDLLLEIERLAREESSVSTSQETVYFFVIYIIIIIIESKIPTSHSVSSSTEEYHYSISFSRETSSHAQTPPHT